MSPFLALLRHQTRQSRSLLLVIPAVNALVLTGVHVQVPGADAAAVTSALLIATWTLYIASDAFASDLACGRMATLALLPVRPLALWASRASFASLAAGFVAATAVATGMTLQLSLGSSESVGRYLGELSAMARFVPLFVLLASVGLLASSLIESALAAAFACVLVLGAAVWTWVIGIAGLLELCDLPARTHELGAIPLAASAVAAVAGAVGFVRCQRRLGQRWVRVRSALSVLAASVLAAGSATACEAWRRCAISFESPDTRYTAGVASPDGRYLAIQGDSRSRGAPSAVWLLDLDTGARETLASSGFLPRDGRNRHVLLGWDDLAELRVFRIPVLSRSMGGLFRFRLDSDELVSEWQGFELPEESTSSPDLAQIALVPPREGRALVRVDDRIELRDLETGETRVALDGQGPIRLVRPSPDGLAVAVSTRAWHVLDAATGAALLPAHSEWVEWVQGGARELRLVGAGRERLVDLDTGREFEVERDPREPFFVRVGDRGYVFIDRAGDLVLVDLEGRLVRVLFHRGGQA